MKLEVFFTPPSPMDEPTRRLPVLWQAFNKHTWGTGHISAARSSAQNYVSSGAIKLSAEFDTQVGHGGLRFSAEPLTILGHNVGDACHSLRASLDTAISVLMRNKTGSQRQRTNFPIHSSKHEMEKSFQADNAVGKFKRGPNFPIRENIPLLEQLIMERFKPWEDGNFDIWALGKLDNANKHSMVIPSVGIVQLNDVCGRAGNLIINRASFCIRAGETHPILGNNMPITELSVGRCSASFIFGGEVNPLKDAGIFEFLERSSDECFQILNCLEHEFGGQDVFSYLN